MKQKLKKIITIILPVIDIMVIPFSIIAAIIMRMYREIAKGKRKMRMTKKIFLRFGVWPLLD